MRYHIKPPGGFLWDSLTTDSLTSEIEKGRLQGDWKIRREGDSTTHTVDELCREESGRKGERSAAAPKLDSSGNAASNLPVEAAAPPRRTMFYLLSYFLIATFLWRVLTAANEFDSPELVYFSIGLDVLCVVALIGSKMQISRAAPPAQPPWIAGNLLFFLALIAGLGLLAIRFGGGTESWWTGHVRYELLPRR
jgi:hypothetical protein